MEQGQGMLRGHLQKPVLPLGPGGCCQNRLRGRELGSGCRAPFPFHGGAEAQLGGFLGPAAAPWAPHTRRCPVALRSVLNS